MCRRAGSQSIVTEDAPAVGDLDLRAGDGLELGPNRGSSSASAPRIVDRLGGPRPEAEARGEAGDER